MLAEWHIWAGRLRDETMAIGKMLEKTMMEKHGPAELQKHYMVMDTICDATQVRSLPHSQSRFKPLCT